MQFDQHTVVLLVTNPDAPQLDEERAAALQDAHLAFLADLHDAGHLLAVGPLADPAGELRGLSLMNVGADEARALAERDPAVEAGVYLLRIIPWSVPAGAMHFTPTFLPRSLADVLGTQSAQS
jgi:uncharacterized protein YciI